MAAFKNFAGLLVTGAVAVACLIPANANATPVLALEGPGAEACSPSPDRIYSFECNFQKLNGKDNGLSLNLVNGDYEVTLTNATPSDRPYQRPILAQARDAKGAIGDYVFINVLKSEIFGARPFTSTPWKVAVTAPSDSVLLVQTRYKG